MIAAHDILRLVELARDLLRRHHVLPAGSERRLLPVLRCERGEFLMRVAEIVGLRARRRETRLLLGQRRSGLPHRAMRSPHGERLRLHWDVPDDLPEVLAPSLSIQPQAENAIRHGIERRPDGGQVEVIARLAGDRVEVLVSNDLALGNGSNAGHAVGLASARERVHALTDGRGRLDAGVEDGRFVARMRVPLES